MSDLEATRGSDEYYDIVAKLATVPQDITGASVWFVIKRSKSDSDAQALVMKTVGAGVTIDPDQTEGGNRGQCVVHLDEADTKNLVGDYFYGLQIRRGGVTTEVADGTITITPDLVRA